MNSSASSLRSLHDHYVLLADPRTRTWFFMGSPVPVMVVIVLYLLFATRLGPWFMRDRKPLNVRGVVVFYNVVMMGLSVYFICFAILYASTRKPGQSVFCWGTDPRPTEHNMFFLTQGWYYMLMKAGEMLDTLFFVLRKKTTHLSFLHLLHHSLALWSVWLVLTLGMTGHVFSVPATQLGRPRGNVRVLRTRRARTCAAAEPVVEEVCNVDPDCTVRSSLAARAHPCVRRLRHAQDTSLGWRTGRSAVRVTVLGLLR
ncbi:hypothetical protein HPB50_006369 [Hyalomma asiaticum]|uniref:Uncharacterized protein n=1 Tax=Hyalomma asiaticum TaxID=266040 RepID=A0ACB7S1U5_HYAAI|nr:hypothetical protein HPB50_006369 [Hyalomma asiaticum]